MKYVLALATLVSVTVLVTLVTTAAGFPPRDGEADFVTGGKMTDPKVTAPGQTRGSGIEGGVVHHLSKGDVITIPAKTPHQWKDPSKTGSIGYYAVNFETP